MRRGALYFAAVFLVFLGAASIRLMDLRADPPPTLSHDFISDEAWWARNARTTPFSGNGLWTISIRESSRCP